MAQRKYISHPDAKKYTGRLPKSLEPFRAIIQDHYEDSDGHWIRLADGWVRDTEGTEVHGFSAQDAVSVLRHDCKYDPHAYCLAGENDRFARKYSISYDETSGKYSGDSNSAWYKATTFDRLVELLVAGKKIEEGHTVFFDGGAYAKGLPLGYTIQLWDPKAEKHVGYPQFDANELFNLEGKEPKVYSKEGAREIGRMSLAYLTEIYGPSRGGLKVLTRAFE